MKTIIGMLLFSIFVNGCFIVQERLTPASCLDYCNRLMEWSKLCHNVDFDFESCKKHFDAYPEYFGELNLVCWQHVIRMFPNTLSELDCNESRGLPDLSHEQR